MSAKTSGRGELQVQADRFARDLEARNQAATSQLLAAWTDSYQGVRAELDTFLAKVQAARDAGTPTSPAWAYQERRLKVVMAEAEAQVARYAAAAADVTEAAERAALSAGLEHSEALTRAAVEGALSGIDASFVQVNPSVLQAGVGLLSDGSVLRNHLAATMPAEAAEAIRRALTHGLATGKSIAWMVREATQAYGLSHTRATTILRTETLRSYRAASRAEYLANAATLSGWTWQAALDARTCVACALMDGTQHPLDETLDGHPRCRCAMVPRTKSWEELLGDAGKDIPDSRPTVRSGEDWFLSQTSAVQRAMMGPAKFTAWRDGEIALGDVVGRPYSTRWGSMRRERSLVAIREGRDANY